MVTSKKPVKKRSPKKRSVKKATAKKPAARATPEPEKPVDKIKMAPAPQAGRKVTDFEKSLDAVLEQEPNPEHGGKRPGAGRKPKPAPAVIDRIQPTEIGAAVVQFLKIPFDLWAAKAEIPELSLTDDEANTAARPTMILLEHYSPNLGEIAIAWASLAVVTAAIMRPRIMILRKYPNKSPSATGTPGGAGESTAPAPAGTNTTLGYPTDKQVKPQQV